VIPIAGMGTRFMPVTKALAKELLPIIDKPIIHYIVQEAVDAGIETIVFVTARSKVNVEDYFDQNDYSRYRLIEKKKEKLIESVLELSKKVDFVSIRQYEAKGLGHAVLTAEAAVGSDPFAVLLGDDVIDSGTSSSAIGQCIECFEKNNFHSSVGVLEVPKDETDKYGIVALKNENEITSFVEKPKPEEAPSNWALPGRYVFDAKIFEYIKNTAPGKGNEIQLTDAMSLMLQDHPYFAAKISGERFDTGDKLGYLKANIRFALEKSDYAEELKNWLASKYF